MATQGQLWKIDPMSAGKAYGTLDAVSDHLRAIRQAVKDGRHEYAVALVDLTEAHVHMTLAAVSASPEDLKA